MISEDQLTELTGWNHPVLAVCLLAAIVDLGAPLDFHLILGAGLYTAIYIAGRAFGKYFGARLCGSWMDRPSPDRRYQTDSWVFLLYLISFYLFFPTCQSLKRMQ